MLGCFPGPAYDLLNQRLVLSHYSFFNCSFWEIKAGTLELFETAKFFLSGYSFSEPNVRRFFSLDKSPIFYAKSFLCKWLPQNSLHVLPYTFDMTEVFLLDSCVKHHVTDLQGC